MKIFSFFLLLIFNIAIGCPPDLVGKFQQVGAQGSLIIDHQCKYTTGNWSTYGEIIILGPKEIKVYPSANEGLFKIGEFCDWEYTTPYYLTIRCVNSGAHQYKKVDTIP
jgi:hypothetical protein